MNSDLENELFMLKKVYEYVRKMSNFLRKTMLQRLHFNSWSTKHCKGFALFLWIVAILIQGRNSVELAVYQRFCHLFRRFPPKKTQCDNIFLNRNYKGNAMTFAEGINKSTYSESWEFVVPEIIGSKDLRLE